MSALPDSNSYQTLLADLKQRIRAARVRAALAVNRELVLLYWGIGKEILARQGGEGWGSKVVERLAKDLRVEFPEMKGISRTNLLYMRAFAEAWPEEPIVQQVAGQLPWFHNCTILDKVKLAEERLWYTPGSHPEWLEPERSCDADRDQPISPPRKGDHELPDHASAPSI